MPPLPLDGEPGPFALADPAKARRVLTSAGFHDVEVQPYDVTLATTDHPDTVAAWLIEVGPAGAAYRATPPPRQAAARTAVARLLGRYRAGTEYRMPAGLWLITASNPR